jgi:hypothetical protein
MGVGKELRVVGVSLSDRRIVVGVSLSERE